MDSRVLRAGAAHKNALDFTEKGMLRKDDLFKVVFDPGSDKREKRILGPVFSQRRRHRRSAVRQMQQRSTDSTP